METTFGMLTQAVTVTSHFVETLPPPGVPTVTTQCATAISSYAGTVNLNFTMGSFSSVEVRFACKRLTDPAWFYSASVPTPADGSHAEVLTGLVSQTQYEFKGQLRYGSTVIEGVTRQFTTATGSGTNLNDLLAYFGCFIATAAYGTPTAEQINVLRDFRDVVLLKSTLVKVAVGDQVKQGDVLATLDSTDLQLKVTQAEQSYLLQQLTCSEPCRLIRAMSLSRRRLIIVP